MNGWQSAVSANEFARVVEKFPERAPDYFAVMMFEKEIYTSEYKFDADEVCERINAAVKKAVQEERDVCAKMCDRFADEVKSTLGFHNQYPYQRVARAIRSRGK